MNTTHIVHMPMTPTGEAEKVMDASTADSAFPWMVSTPEGNWAATGLSKRELFAAMAMQGLLTQRTDFCADVAVEAADALLAELAKEKDEPVIDICKLVKALESGRTTLNGSELDKIVRECRWKA